MKYAGFWIRLGALVIDCIIIVPLNNYILSYIGDGSILRILVTQHHLVGLHSWADLLQSSSHIRKKDPWP